MPNVHGYEYSLKDSHDSPNGTWWKATKEGKTYFIKRFKEPKYPRDGLDPQFTAEKRAECDAWFAVRKNLLSKLKTLGDGSGNSRFPIEIFREKSSYYQVTHWVDIQKQELHDIARMSDDDKLFLLQTYASALSKIHRVDIIHGDLKPDNVLVGKSGSGKPVAKLIDFDDSYFSGKALPPHLTKSTEIYKSPELAAYIVGKEELRPRLTTASDVFTSGIIFHEFWTGRQPVYTGADAGKMLYQAIIARENIEFDERIPKEIRNLIKSMLSREPEKRPTMDQVYGFIKGVREGKIVIDDTAEKERRPVTPPSPPVSPVSPDYTKLKNVWDRIPHDLDSNPKYPKLTVERIKKIVHLVKVNLKSMTQNDIDKVTQLLYEEMKKLSTVATNVNRTVETPVTPSGTGRIVPADPLPANIKAVEIIGGATVKVTLSNGSKFFKTKAQALAMGAIKEIN